MSADYLSTFVEELKRPPPELEQTGPPPEPEHLTGYQRAIRVIDAPIQVATQYVSVEEAREMIWQEMSDYAQLTRPQHMLLIKAVPGVGKTTLALLLAEELARQGRRVLYAAPRHDFIADLRAIAKEPQMIYEWLPRQEGNEQKLQTCLHTENINLWLNKGYKGKDFCSGICGWDYFKKSCPYHLQEKRPEPIIMGQHAHIALGHPLMEKIQFVIGDESPLSAFLHPWAIPARWIMPPGMDWAEPLTEILRDLGKLAEDDNNLEGPLLLNALGGAERVLEACQTFILPLTDLAYIPPLEHKPGNAENAPYFHLKILHKLFLREAEAALGGNEYPHRIIIKNKKMTLLLRRQVSDQLPPHVIWLDATGNEHLYTEMFGRQVKAVAPQVQLQGKIYQITDRLNNRKSLVQEEKSTDFDSVKPSLPRGGSQSHEGPRFTPSKKTDQLAQQVAHIIQIGNLQNPGFISFQAVTRLDKFEHLDKLHFYGARGTNTLQHIDGLIVAGTPMPPDLDKTARMLFFARMTPFNLQWQTKDVPYNYTDDEGKGRAYPTSGYWGDPDMESLLWQHREAELIQAVHRSRPVLNDTPIYLLSNLPIWELPPAELLQLYELFNAPAGVNVHKWQVVMDFVQEMDVSRGSVTTVDLINHLSLNRDTASKYIDFLVRQYGWQEVKAATRGRGMPPKAITSLKARHL